MQRGCYKESIKPDQNRIMCLQISIKIKNPAWLMPNRVFLISLMFDYSLTTPISQNFSIRCSIILSVFNLPKAARSFKMYSFKVLPINSGS